jgi:nucleoside-diphosphate-sugar epimerase
MKVLILGVNGFIGNALVARILETTAWEVWGMDLTDSKLGASLGDPRFHFVEGDIGIHREWVEYHVKKCDVVIPLVAIATPASYVRDPIGVFELDFEENLRIVRQCHRYGKRLVFPSTSEVYGMCPDESFDEDQSSLVYGPIGKSRWIYAASKQLLDRVIAAYGEKEGLRFTCFRPFNWVGPKLDDLNAAKEGSSRVVTQFIERLIHGQPLQIVDGGEQRRCYTWLGDGIDGLMAILTNEGGVCEGQIFNLGHPGNECTVRELAEKLAGFYEQRMASAPSFVAPRLEAVAARDYYGAGYQDMVTRRPKIDKAGRLLAWTPRVGLDETLSRTLDAFLADHPPSAEDASEDAARPGAVARA